MPHLAIRCIGALAALGITASALAQTATTPVTPPAAPGAAAAPVRVVVGYLRVRSEAPVPISRIRVPPADLGLAGAALGIGDNQTTGRFTRQEFVLETADVPAGADPLPALAGLIAKGAGFVAVDAPADAILALADAAAPRGVQLINVGASDVALREENCRANLLHTAPDRAMLADALAQYLTWKKWTRLFLIAGVNPPDRAMADALRRAARRFGLRIVEEREYAEAGGARRSDTGHAQVQQQMPVFTQRAKEHDVLIVADESEVFGPYMAYRAWDARPVAGTSGLVPESWHPAHEQWGGTQLQTRFERSARRGMQSLDYQAWMAMRVVGEAATRTKSADVQALRGFILGPQMGLAAFKGQPLTFRTWNRQLRQPVLLTTLDMPVTVSPQPGFMHQRAEVDTLGIDEPETKCTAR